MQPKFRKIPQRVKGAGLLVRDMVEPYFYNPYHYHPQYELTSIIRGSGTRYIGDHVEKFEEGDLIFVGANLAHLWRCDDIYYKEKSDLTVRAIVIQFKEGFLGHNLWQLEEMRLIKKLLVYAKQGIKISNRKKPAIKDRMVDMLTYDPVDQIACLLSILNAISKLDELELLASPGFTNIDGSSNKEKINKTCSFVINNFQDDIRLDDAARIIHMTPEGFCRFFKRETHKTFISYINEVRIGYACKLLIDDSFAISQIALESGYNTISYFNRQFKKMVGETPSQYKSHFKHDKV